MYYFSMYYALDQRRGLRQFRASTFHIALAEHSDYPISANGSELLSDILYNSDHSQMTT